MDKLERADNSRPFLYFVFCSLSDWPTLWPWTLFWFSRTVNGILTEAITQLIQKNRALSEARPVNREEVHHRIIRNE